MAGGFRNTFRAFLATLPGFQVAAPGMASSAPVGPPTSCQGEAVLAAPGKAPGTEGVFFAVPSVSRAVSFMVAGDRVTLTIGQRNILYTRQQADRTALARIIAQLGDLDAPRRAVWLDSLLGGAAIVADNEAEMLLVLREPGRSGWSGVMLKDGAPAAFLSLKCD